MAKRRERKEFEMLWRGARSFGDAADVFTSNWPSGKWRPWQCLLGRGIGTAVIRDLRTLNTHTVGSCCFLCGASW